jgi:hypothetical protein
MRFIKNISITSKIFFPDNLGLIIQCGGEKNNIMSNNFYRIKSVVFNLVINIQISCKTKVTL